MKLRLLVASMALVGSTAFAQSSVTVVYGIQEAVPSNVQSHVTNFSARTTVIKDLLTVDGGIQTTTQDISRQVTNRYEIGTTIGQNLNDTFRADVRLATGIKSVSAKQDFAYYSVEPGVTARLGDFSARVAYRFRTAYDSVPANNNDTSNTIRYSVGYNVTKKDRVALGYDVLRGDGANNSSTISYTRSF